jgi:hypothetical protein
MDTQFVPFLASHWQINVPYDMFGDFDSEHYRDRGLLVSKSIQVLWKDSLQTGIETCMSLYE